MYSLPTMCHIMVTDSLKELSPCSREVCALRGQKDTQLNNHSWVWWHSAHTCPGAQGKEPQILPREAVVWDTQGKRKGGSKCNRVQNRAWTKVREKRHLTQVRSPQGCNDRVYGGWEERKLRAGGTRLWINMYLIRKSSGCISSLNTDRQLPERNVTAPSLTTSCLSALPCTVACCSENMGEIMCISSLPSSLMNSIALASNKHLLVNLIKIIFSSLEVRSDKLR